MVKSQMFFLYLSTHRTTRSRAIIIKQDDKRAIHSSHPASLYDNELLEACKDTFLMRTRLISILRSYGDLPIDSPISTSYSFKERIRLGFKIVLNITDEERLRRSTRMKENNPNKDGISDEHKEKIAASKRGKPSGWSGKKASLETRQQMSVSSMGNKAVKGLLWCYDPYTGQHKRIRDISLLPDGWFMGRDPGYMGYIRSHWKR